MLADDDKIVFGNRRCPFGSMVMDRPSMCMMTSNVFGKIADFFDQPCMLLDRRRHIREANVAARGSLCFSDPSELGSLYDLSMTPKSELDRYLKACSTGTVPKPGTLTARLCSGEVQQFHSFAARYEIEGVIHPFLFLRLSKKWAALSKLHELNRQIAVQHRQLHEHKNRHERTLVDLNNAKRRSRTDQLTGLLNRNALISDFERLERVWPRRRDDFLAFVLIDLDGMKAVNDRYGHEKGDEFLRRFGRAVKAQMRDEDLIYRTGGDEFVCLIHGRELLPSLRDRLDNIIGQIRREYFCEAGYSMGFAQSTEVDKISDLYALADRRMYSEKRSHKQRRHS